MALGPRVPVSAQNSERPTHMPDQTDSQQLTIGWAGTDLTPEQPVFICGQFHARVSEGVLDPVTATALALESGKDHAVLVSCDVVTMPDALRDAIRERVRAAGEPDLDPRKVVLHATHTHTGPELRLPRFGAGHCSSGPGVELKAYFLRRASQSGRSTTGTCPPSPRAGPNSTPSSSKLTTYLRTASPVAATRRTSARRSTGTTSRSS